MNETALEVRGFSFRIGAKPILRDVSFSVAAGEYLSIVGPNGAGKTTLLKCIDRVLTGGTGAIAVFGRALAEFSQRDLARRLSYVPQSGGPAFPFSVIEFVRMGRYPYLGPFASVDRQGQQAIDEALALTGTAEFADRMLDTLSGGERQKVFLAAALAQQADILLLDEPTTFLDYRHQAEIRDLLARVNRRGTTIVSVTHDLNRAVLDSRRVLALCGGEVAFWGMPNEIMRHEVLERIYQTEFFLASHPQAAVPIVLPGLAAEGP